MTGPRTGTRTPGGAPFPPARRRWTGPGVPAPALPGATLSARSASFPADTVHDRRHAGPSLRMHIFGRAGPGAGLAVPVPHTGPRRGALRRGRA
ncbi:hypothetical protein [Streptomyces sioyaensis]|uniref:hypothetical protein n=1 Tax=Streptomyces sioyaensis TaxID=67364 RepID=UPI00370F807A